MISDEQIQSWADDLTEEEPLKHALLELLAHRKACREPACYVNASDIERKELHVLARQIKSKSCTLPLYRKPFSD